MDASTVAIQSRRRGITGRRKSHALRKHVDVADTVADEMKAEQSSCVAPDIVANLKVTRSGNANVI